jgi:hypothetical protein
VQKKSCKVPVYTAMEMLMYAVPWCVEGWINPAIPKEPGIYALLSPDTLLYVGKAEAGIRKRVYCYREDEQFALVWWQLIDREDCSPLEQFYIKRLRPPLNGAYHPRDIYYRQLHARSCDRPECQL